MNQYEVTLYLEDGDALFGVYEGEETTVKQVKTKILGSKSQMVEFTDVCTGTLIGYADRLIIGYRFKPVSKKD